MLDPVFYTKIEEQSETFARVIFEPLSPSFGQSMGNALRRTLLSSLKGAAIGHVKISGAPHLFTTIKGVKESVLDMVLNMKQIHFRVPAEGTYKAKLSVKKVGKVYAKDFEGEVKPVNDDLYIAEITDDKGALEIEVVIETGYGYVASEEKEEKHTGFIAIDSAFSPIKKVNFKVEAARVGRKSNHDRLILEVWTDGAINPVEAIKEATNILAKHFQHVQSSEESPTAKEGDLPQVDKRDDEGHSKLDDIIIDELNLPSRVINALLRENIETVADLIERGREKLVGLKGVGRKSIDLIEEELKKMSIELK